MRVCVWYFVGATALFDACLAYINDFIFLSFSVILLVKFERIPSTQLLTSKNLNDCSFFRHCSFLSLSPPPLPMSVCLSVFCSCDDQSIAMRIARQHLTFCASLSQLCTVCDAKNSSLIFFQVQNRNYNLKTVEFIFICFLFCMLNCVYEN